MRFIRDAIITLIGLVLVILIAGYFGLRQGLSAEAQPGPVERAVASRLARLAIPEDARKSTSPFTDPSVWRDASDHFDDHCAECHGSDGRGNTEMGRNMYPKAPDLTGDSVQRMSDGELFFVIQNGVRWTGMPAWKAEHTTDESWKLVSFIRHLPIMTPDERGAEPHEHHHEHGEHEPPQKDRHDQR